jgi:hypothetical protein
LIAPLIHWTVVQIRKQSTLKRDKVPEHITRVPRKALRAPAILASAARDRQLRDLR